MKTIINYFKKKRLTLAGSLLICLTTFSHAQNAITLVALPGGTEGDDKYTDSSILQISSAGAVSYYNSNTSDDWGVSASTITPSGALGKTFSITFGGMSAVKTTEGNDFGKMITAGGIDRASTGPIGIRGGISNGIDPNEGLYFGLDLSNINTTAAIQITKISVADLNATNETGIIVSRLNPSKRIIFGNAESPGITHQLSSGSGTIDVSDFNLYVLGGQINNSLVSIFNNSSVASGFRITTVELKVLTNIFNPASITAIPHPRLLLKQGQEASINTLIAQSPEFNTIHTYIMSQANAFLSEAPLVYNPVNGRMLETARSAIKQIFFLSYAYRMTANSAYATKAEQVINTVCNFPDWVTYSLDVAEMCFAVSIGYDWLYNNLPAATKQKAREKILNYAFLTQKTKPFWDFTSNWNQVCIGGLAYGAMAILGDGTSQMDTEAKYILNNILVKNPNSMDTYASGNYQEGPMYWSYGTTYEVLLLSALEGIFGQNHEGFKRLTFTPGFLESAKYMQYITGTSSLYFNYSDCTEERTPLPASLWMAKKLNDLSIFTLEKELMQNGRYTSNYSEDVRFLPIALIYGKDLGIGSSTLPTEKIWKGYGTNPVALVRTSWQGNTGNYIGIKGGTPNYSHAHMDGGSFVYDAQGVRWTVDFGKEDYEAIKANITPAGADNDFSQTSNRWNIFRISNISHNTISIKKTSETSWQKHKVNGNATITEIYDTSSKRGAKVDLKSLIGLNNELDAINRSIYLVNDTLLEIKDYIDNGNEAINLYWNMATTALIESISPSKLKLTKGGKTAILEIISNNSAVTFTTATNRSTDPVSYFPAATYERKNEGSVMVGFTATIPANEIVTFTVKISNGPEVPPSSTEPINYILLELPNPNTGLEGNSLYYDSSEFHVDNSGDVSIGGIATDYAWNVYGNTNIPDILTKKFFLRWYGMATTNTTTGTNYGAMLTPGGIDRSANGELGIRGGESNGIDLNEGFRFGFDAATLPTTTSLQLVKVGVNFVSGSRSGTIVNRNNTSNKISFGGSSSSADFILSSGSGLVNVESLNISIPGGSTNYDMASVFNTGGSGSFRITKLVFKIISTATSPLMSNKQEANLEKQTKEIIVYPNPAMTDIFIENLNSKFNTVKFFNSLGICVLENKISSSSKIDLYTLKPGIYTIHIIGKDNTTITKKIIKQ
ncbi:hypothetical protein Pedsa_2492 [Pseudopedobacter saltans DSM 12145]|uniref:Uncharacterized protein n=1 Tax=Pseudopedobacter saltans (strain ATCC 51119 / DSM 12145 / JCM 21818 / CCUG 39354 / LMG 10337 / NBRC 100064 / NCIMB 13643) TaxID=762903 RepID=F0SEX1_PSESL|nr:T9SS type A sorting domain-containing protein [Pseudopedobacter saltans]ADY53037.1 hypothetical protein Pedsa_2492 [Pseudopedobacter saltans DSM 12145]